MPWSSCERRSALFREAFGVSFLVPAPADAGSRVAVRIDEHQVRDVNRRLSLRDPPGNVLGGVRPRVAFDQIDALHDRPSLRRQDPQDLALSAPVLPGSGDDEIVLLGLRLVLHHSTSGATESISMNYSSPCSRATVP